MFKELFIESGTAAKSLTKQQRLDNKSENEFICTDELKALFKNKVQFTIKMANGEIIRFEQLGSRKWKGLVQGKHRMLNHSSQKKGTANEILQHMADIGFITGDCEILKVDGKDI